MPGMVLFRGGNKDDAALQCCLSRWHGLAEKLIEPLLIQGRGCHGLPAFW
jgi:hypothetical protein